MVKMDKVWLKNVKDEVVSFNGWQGHACIMLDLDDGDVWTDVFASDNEWKEYRSDSIICIYAKDNFEERNLKVSVDKIVNICKGELFKEWRIVKATATLKKGEVKKYAAIKVDTEPEVVEVCNTKSDALWDFESKYTSLLNDVPGGYELEEYVIEEVILDDNGDFKELAGRIKASDIVNPGAILKGELTTLDGLNKVMMRCGFDDESESIHIDGVEILENGEFHFTLNCGDDHTVVEFELYDADAELSRDTEIVVSSVY